jgi:putative flippase GtrA
MTVDREHGLGARDDSSSMLRSAPETRVAAIAPASAVTSSRPMPSAEPVEGTPLSRVPRSRRAERAGSQSHKGQHRREIPEARLKLFVPNTRFIAFGAVGGGVFVMGLGFQVLLVRGLHFSALASYVVQGFVSVQVSFLLNRIWTWRDVRVSFFPALVKFNVQKIVTTIANTVIYDGLLNARLNYLIANISTTAIFTIVNYLAADNWVFARPDLATDVAMPAISPVGQEPATCPTVSVVVPCKNNERTILATATALLTQDYPGLESVILVGSLGDSTWQALAGVRDTRLIILEQSPIPGKRDPNVKRHRGIESCQSELIALADSDIVMAPDWLSKGIALMMARGTQCVAGGMQSIHATFWGRFVDRTRMGAKTPRVSSSYMVTRRNFGSHGRKPPVTANVILTRQLYEECPLDVNWSYGYEDYEWFWRITRAGHRILFSHELSGRHHHRRGLIPLCREYLRASSGCARFIRRHPDCPLAIKRLRQAYLLPLAGIGTVSTCVIGIAYGAGTLVSAGLAIVAVATVMWEYLGGRAPESVVYPLLNLLLGSLFVCGLLKGLSERQQDHQAMSLTPPNEACA